MFIILIAIIMVNMSATITPAYVCRSPDSRLAKNPAMLIFCVCRWLIVAFIFSSAAILGVIVDGCGCFSWSGRLYL